MFEVEQRGTFERKHGEGAFHDIRQDIPGGITHTVVGKVREFGAQNRHQFVKGQLLLELRYFLTMRSNYTVGSNFQIENCCETFLHHVKLPQLLRFTVV